MLTCGKGQKVGIFAGSGVGKSTLMGMIVKGCEAQIKVIALIGERGREIPEFIHYQHTKKLENIIIITATSDESALMRKYGAFTAMAVAEFFRDKGHDVLLMMNEIEDINDTSDNVFSLIFDRIHNINDNQINFG